MKTGLGLSSSSGSPEGAPLTATKTMLAELVQDWITPAGPDHVQLLFASVPMPRQPAH